MHAANKVCLLYSLWHLFQLNQAFLRELSEETGLTFSEGGVNLSTLGLWEVFQSN